jgi:hypothetical protein
MLANATKVSWLRDPHRYNYLSVARNAMHHLNSKRLMPVAAVLAVMSYSASGQMMRQSSPPPHVDMSRREQLVTEDSWIHSMVDRWTSPQRKSWQELDPPFRGWVSHLVWVPKNVGHLSVLSDLPEPGFQVPSACPVTRFASPVHSVAESMGYFRDVLPDINWNAWNSIEPNFREIAEWEMHIEHARAQVSKSAKDWWELNSETVQSCLNAAEQSKSTTMSVASTAPSVMPRPNPSYEQIDRRAKSELAKVSQMIAPEPIKQEVREQISDAAAVDKYLVAMDRRKP